MAAAASRLTRGSNPHIVAALGLVVIAGVLFAAILAFGDPRAAIPAVRVAVPAAPPPPAPDETRTAAADAPPEVGLRGDQVALDDPALDRLAPPPPQSGDQPTLAGVTPIDEDAPVRTSRELAAASSESAAAPSDPAFPNALPPAPVAALTEPGPNGPLPVIRPDGQRPSEAYARPFTPDGRPEIGLIVGGLGMSESRTRTAIETLPPEVTLAFVPYAENLQSWIDLARKHGHETLLEIPMEPFDYPQNDPGPHTLLTSVERAENIRRLDWLLSRAAGYFGVTNYLGAKFSASGEAMSPVFSALSERGLALVHDGAQVNSPLGEAAGEARLDWTSADRVIDSSPSPEAINQQLLQLEALALRNGEALGAGFAYPVTIEQARRWAGELDSRGYTLAPASAVLELRGQE